MRKFAAVLLCLLPLTAAGKELKLDLKYQGAIDSALLRADDRVDARRELGAIAKSHAKASNRRHGFGRLWASMHGPKPGRCKP